MVLNDNLPVEIEYVQGWEYWVKGAYALESGVPAFKSWEHHLQLCDLDKAWQALCISYFSP